MQQKPEKRTLRTEPSPEYRTRRAGEAASGHAAEVAESSSGARRHAYDAASPAPAAQSSLATSGSARHEQSAREAVAVASPSPTATAPTTALHRHVAASPCADGAAAAHETGWAGVKLAQALVAVSWPSTTVCSALEPVWGVGSDAAETVSQASSAEWRIGEDVTCPLETLSDSVLLPFLQSRCATLRWVT